MALRMTLATNVRARRQRLKLTKAELASRMLVATSFVRAVERAERSVHLSDLERLARALQTSAYSLLRPYN